MSEPVSDLERLEGIFFRIALAEDTTLGLQGIVDQFLVKILSFLSPTPNDQVKAKVVEILSHLNKRLQANTAVKLPLADLFSLLADRQSSLLLVNFAKVYVRMGFKRGDCADLLPQVLTNQSLSPQNDASLFIFLLSSCLRQLGTERANFDKMSANLKSVYISPPVARILLTILLYPYAASQNYPCLSAGEVKALQESGVVSDDLETLKIAAVNLLAVKNSALETATSTGAAGAEQFAAHYVIAANDPVGRVASYAEVQLRHLANAINWTTSQTVLETLIQLYLGSAQQRPQSAPATAGHPVPQPTSPADLRLRLKLLPAIAKFSSQVTCEMRSRCVQLLFDTLFSPGSNSKLKQLMLQFAQTWLDAWLWEKLAPLASLLSTAFVQVLKQTDQDESIKPLAYSAVGKIFSKFPSMIEQNLELVLTMLRIIETESGEQLLLGEDVETALNMLALPICQQIQVENRDGKIYPEIERLCQATAKRANRVALRYLRLFPPNHLESRFLLFQLSAKSDPDFRLECLKALFEPYLPKEEQPDSLVQGVANPLKPELIFPKFVELLSFFYDNWQKGKSVGINYGNNQLPFSSQTCTQIALFLRTILVVSEASAPPFDVLVATVQFQDLQRSSPHLFRYFQALPNSQLAIIFELMTSILLDILRCQSEPLALFLMVELVKTLPGTILREKTTQLRAILPICQQFTSSTSNFDAVELFCELHGALENLSEFDEKTMLPHLRQPVRLLCLGHLVIANLRNKEISPKIQEIETFFVKESLSILTNNPDSHDRLVTLKAISVGSLCFPLWKCGELVDRVSDSWTKALSVKETRLRPWAIQAFGRFGCSIFGKSGDDNKRKMLEKLLSLTPDEDIYMWIAQAVVDLTLGPLSATSTANLWRIDPNSYDPITSDQLLSAKIRLFSPEIESTNAIISSCGDHLTCLVDQFVQIQLRNSSKFVRECSLVSLFVLLKSGFKTMPDLVRQRFATVNQALFQLLTEDNAHIQQTLCELLSFMYEATEESQREKQLEPLVDVLMGRKTVGLSSVAGQTEVFKEGQLGDMPEGQKLNTYKELCSLASDLNQPDLIYRFMTLANHNADWLSKSCAAAGLGSILAASKSNVTTSSKNSKLAGSLLSGIGKLYRYQFDPDANVRQSMQQLWQLVMQQSGESNVRDLVNSNMEAIFVDIDVSLPNRLWRVRESACGALSDSLRVLVDAHDKRLLKRLPSFWNAILHLCDDIKESVRLAAAKTARSLQKVTIRLAQSRKIEAEGASAIETTTNEASICLGLVIETLFKSGVESKAEEVRAVSLATLMLLVDSAGQSLLAVHCNALIPAFLESASSLEPQVLSYVTARATDETELAALESIRARVAGMSPITQSVEQCLDIIPLEQLPDLFLRLCDLVKPSAGLITRTATCQAVTQLVLRRFRGGKMNVLSQVEQIDQPLNRLFTALLSTCCDRSEPIRRAGASTLAHLSCLKPNQFVKKAANRACEWYLKGSLQLDEDSDPLLAKAACSLLQSLAQLCPMEILQQEQAQATMVPCLFFALHEKSVTQDEQSGDFKRVAAPQPDAWDDIWNEICQGSETVLKRHCDGVCDLLLRCSEVQRYGLRLQTAITVETLVTKISSHLNAENVGKLSRCLVALLQGRTWPNKETIVEILSKFAESLGESKIDPESYSAMVTCLVREAKKAQLEYSVVAFKALCSLVDIVKQQEDVLFASFDDFLSRCCANFIGNGSNNLMETDQPQQQTGSLIKKLGVVAEFVDVTNKSKCLPSHLVTIDKNQVTNVVQLFCLAMQHTTTSNSTKQLAARLINGFELLLGRVLVEQTGGDSGDDCQQAVLECVRLSAKLTDARTVETAAKFLACLRHFFKYQPALISCCLEKNDEIRQEIAALVKFIRSKSKTTVNGDDIAFFESKITL